MGEVTEYPRSGRPYHPTDKERIIVENAAAFGEPHARIARYLGIDVKTLYRHYRDELENGLFRANLKIGQTIYELATTAKDENVKLRAASFWAARRMGWTEKVVNEHTGPNGGPVQSINANMSAQEAVDAYQAMLRIEYIPPPIEESISDENME